MQNDTAAFTTKTFSLDVQRENYQKRRRNRKKARLLIVLVIWALIGLYFILPVSRVGKITYTGNVYISDDELNEIMDINKSSLLLLVDETKGVRLLNEHPYVSYVKFKRTPFNISIHIEEIVPIAYQDNLLLLSNGKTINKHEYHYYNDLNNLPLISGQLDAETKLLVVSKMSKLDSKVLNNMLEISLEPIGLSSFYYAKTLFLDDNQSYLLITNELNYLDTKLSLDKYEEIVEKVGQYIEENDIITSVDNPVSINCYLLENKCPID